MDGLKWGVEIRPLRQIDSSLGKVMHGIKKSESSFFGFGEAYFSCIKPGAIKGWKKHKEMTLNLIVPVGLIRFCIFGSKLSGGINYDEAPIEVLVGAQRYSRLTIPPNLWVGFQGLYSEESMLLNVASHEHDSRECEVLDLDEVNFLW